MCIRDSVIDIVGFILAVLCAGKDAADVGFSLGAGAQAGWVRQQGFEELAGYDFLTVKVNGGGGEHSHILKAAHMVQVALAKGHKKADALDVWQVLAQRFNSVSYTHLIAQKTA